MHYDADAETVINIKLASESSYCFSDLFATEGKFYIHFISQSNINTVTGWPGEFHPHF